MGILRVIFLVVSLISGIIIWNLSHPIVLSFILIRITLTVSFSISFFTSSWIIYLLILVFLGGVIILIGYIRTLASNEKIKFKLNKIILYFILSIFNIILLKENYIFSIQSYSLSWVNSIYYTNHNILILFLFIYLLLTIVCVIKLIKIEGRPLVKRL